MNIDLYQRCTFSIYYIYLQSDRKISTRLELFTPKKVLSITIYFYVNLVVMSSQQTCIEGSFFHFQGWKRRYYPFMTRLPHEPISSFLFTSTGFIPWKDSSDLSSTYDNNRLYPPMTYCLQYESNLQKCSCRINTTHIHIFNSLKTFDQQYPSQSITMIKTGYYQDLYQLLNHTIDWPYHKVIQSFLKQVIKLI